MVLSCDLRKGPKANPRGAKKGHISRYFQSLMRPTLAWAPVPGAVECINTTIMLISRFRESGEWGEGKRMAGQFLPLVLPTLPAQS